jgi:hypothetical protein
MAPFGLGKRRTMKINRWILALGVSLLLAVSFACHFSVSTANLSSLKLSKDKTASQETNTFAEGDTVYAVAVVSNAPGKVKVKGRLSIEDVPGENSGPITGLEKILDLPGSGSATYTFSPPPDGWPKGKYKMEVFMLNEDGEQKDQKAASFTVS